MQWFNNLKIMNRLFIGFVLVALLCGAVGYEGITSLRAADDSDIDLYEKNTVPISTLADIASTYQRLRVNLLELTIASSPEKRADLVKQISDRRSDLDKYSKEFEAKITSPEMRQAYTHFLEMRKQYGAIVDQIITLIGAGNSVEATRILNNEGEKLRTEYQASIDKLVKMKVADAKKRSDGNTVEANIAIRKMIIAIVGAFVLAIFFGWFIARSVSIPVTKMVSAAEKLALGDVDVNIEATTKDEIGALAVAFQSAVTNIANAAAASERIARGDLSIRVQEQSDKDILSKNLNYCIDNINMLVTDVNALAQAAVEGKLNTRADVTKHNGDFRKVVEGVNKTLDEVIEPIREASAVLQEMSQGNLQLRVTGNYKGDHAQIKDAMNDTLNALSSYVGEISLVLNEMANSNLDVGINNEYKGDFAQIKDALNLIIETFNEVFTEINSSADQVASGSRQVSDGSQALSQGATEQASSIEELTVSISQVATQTKENAINANQANQLALVAREIAEQGNIQMQEMLKSMGEINESSANISKIIKVIDEIAFQTNILALNAAVEAARAGQHGKGFAVVAEEVRNLAARSANAAKETTTLIEGSIKKVENGTQIANGTAKALYEIVDGVAKAAHLVGDIAGASNDQATSIAQINKGVEQVSQVVQTNSATAEESAAASEELSGQAEILKDMIIRFRLKRGQGNHLRQEAAGFSANSGLEDRKVKQLKPKSNADKGTKPRIALSDKEFGKY